MRLIDLLRRLRNKWSSSRPCIAADTVLAIHDVSLLVNASDAGGIQYDSKSSYEEFGSPFYEEVAKWLNPRCVIDIGANYGFTGLLFAKRFPEARLILIEPSQRLESYICKNMIRNGIGKYELIVAACGKCHNTTMSFALNPNSSQDNRVRGESGWETVNVPVVALSQLAKDCRVDEGVFIKIDTQGYEQQVFEGGWDFLDHHPRWLVKTEFAPFWLRSQGTDPKCLLRSLIARYAVAESPLRHRYVCDTLDRVFANGLVESSIDSFVDYVGSLNRDQTGWCDLLVCPKESPWISNGQQHESRLR